MEMTERVDCKTCAHATTLYVRVRDGDPHTTGFAPSGYVRAKCPRYSGRTYTRRDYRDGCDEYERKKRQ